MHLSRAVWVAFFLAFIAIATATAQDTPRRIAGEVVRFDVGVLDWWQR